MRRSNVYNTYLTCLGGRVCSLVTDPYFVHITDWQSLPFPPLRICVISRAVRCSVRLVCADVRETWSLLKSEGVI